MDEDLERALRDARRAWPAVRVDERAFAAHVESLRGQGGAAPEHLPDVYLAFAAARGDEAALRAFDGDVLAGIDGAVRRVDGAPAFVEEVRQSLRIRLLVSEGGAAPRIAEYRGKGPLAAWVKVAAARVALNLKRGEKQAPSTDEVLAELAAIEPDPELAHLKKLYRAELGAALSEALAELPARQRAVLRLHYVDGLRLAQIGALYRAHESTVSRWVSAALSSVAAAAKRRLVERLALSASGVESIARLVQSQLDLSVRRILSQAEGGS